MLKCFGFVFLLVVASELFSFSQYIEVGPQTYYLVRKREGGSYQEGMLYGGRIAYERIQKSTFYVGLFCDYAKGKIHGATGGGSSLVSNFSDLECQALLGYTLNSNKGIPSRFIPFVGLGYLREINHFLPPSSLTVQFLDMIKYGSIGFLSLVQISKRWNVGIRFTIKEMLEGKCKVSHDPDAEDTTLLMENETQFAIDLPLTYSFCGSWSRFKITFMPLMQFRYYGSRENYPYDFRKTRYNTYGARLLFDLCF